MKTRRLLPLAGLLALLASSSCHDDRPVVIVPPQEPNPLVVDEIEPNDDAWSANDLGFLAPGDHVVIRGEIEDCCDPFDGFAFVSTEPLLVEFFLESHDGGDLDVCVYDPEIDDFSLCFESGGSFEEGAFEVVHGGAEFHTVVAPFDFGSRYTLEVFTSAIALPKSASANGGTGAVRPVVPAEARAEAGGSAARSGDGGERAAAYRGEEPAAAEIVVEPDGSRAAVDGAGG